MKTCFLHRQESTLQGTLGVFASPRDMFSCVTMECPWLYNLTYVSCIPCGQYECVSRWSDKFKKRLYVLQDVPKRTGIEIHPANVGGANWTLTSPMVEHKQEFKTDLLGCIGLGIEYGLMYGQDSVLFSESVFLRFDHLMGNEPFKLIIDRGKI